MKYIRLTNFENMPFRGIRKLFDNESEESFNYNMSTVITEANSKSMSVFVPNDIHDNAPNIPEREEKAVIIKPIAGRLYYRTFTIRREEGSDIGWVEVDKFGSNQIDERTTSYARNVVTVQLD